MWYKKYLHRLRVRCDCTYYNGQVASQHSLQVLCVSMNLSKASSNEHSSLHMRQYQKIDLQGWDKQSCIVRALASAWLCSYSASQSARQRSNSWFRNDRSLRRQYERRKYPESILNLCQTRALHLVSWIYHRYKKGLRNKDLHSSTTIDSWATIWELGHDYLNPSHHEYPVAVDRGR